MASLPHPFEHHLTQLLARTCPQVPVGQRQRLRWMLKEAGDAENAASLLALIAQAEIAVGDIHEGFGSLRRSLRAVLALGEPPRLHDVTPGAGLVTFEIPLRDRDA